MSKVCLVSDIAGIQTKIWLRGSTYLNWMHQGSFGEVKQEFSLPLQSNLNADFFLLQTEFFKDTQSISALVVCMFWKIGLKKTVKWQQGYLSPRVVQGIQHVRRVSVPSLGVSSLSLVSDMSCLMMNLCKARDPIQHQGFIVKRTHWGHCCRSGNWR